MNEAESEEMTKGQHRADCYITVKLMLNRIKDLKKKKSRTGNDVCHKHAHSEWLCLPMNGCSRQIECEVNSTELIYNGWRC